jgi:CBS domain containing-hemolysin-like protein
MEFLITSKFLLFLILLLFLAIFNGAETAVTSLPQDFLRKKKNEKNKNSKYILFWEDNFQEVMTAMIIGMNLSLIGMGVVFTSIGLDIIQYCEIKSKNFMFYFSFIPVLAAMIFGNIFPKTIARYNCEKIGLIALPYMIIFSKFLKKIIKLLSSISNKILGILIKNIDSKNKNERSEEIDFLLSNEKTSPLPLDSRELVSNILDFAERKISNVMIALPEIFAVDIEFSKEEIISKIIHRGYSRIPIYKENINNIIGIIYAKDIAIAWRNSNIIAIEDLIRPAYYVPENAKVSKVLKEFKTGHIHIAIIVDEFGSTVGIASIEDLLEEIVGEVLDEYDYKENAIVANEDGSYLIQGYETISDVNDILDIEIPEGNYVTVNGWVLEIFGKIPKTDEKTKWENYSIEIQDADIKKVNRVILKKIDL